MCRSQYPRDEETVTKPSSSLIQPFPWTSRRHRRRSRSRHRSNRCWRSWRRRCRKEAGFLYEPKWDGFRAIVFRRESDLFIQSRDLRPLDRYFPELRDALLANLPLDCVVDGEIVIPTTHGLDFDALQLRLHPAASRVAKLAKDIPSAFVAFDVLAIDGRDVRELPQSDRRTLLERALANVASPIHVTPMTRDRVRSGRLAFADSRGPGSMA